MGYMLVKIVMDSTTLSSRKDVPKALLPSMYEITWFAIMGFINIIFAMYSFIIRKELGISNVFPFSLGISNHNGHHWTEGLMF